MTALAEAPALDWQSIAEKITAPPRKVVVAMLPRPETQNGLYVADRGIRKEIDKGEEARAWADFSMPKVKSFFEHPRVRAWDVDRRKQETDALIADLRTEFKALYHKRQWVPGRSVQITHEDLGYVVGTHDGGPSVGSLVACHPEDGSRLDALGTDIAVFGAFLPEYEWRPQYCDWWQSVVCEVDLETGSTRPYMDKIIVRLDPQKDKIGGIYIPDSAQRWDADCDIVSVGSVWKDDIAPGERWSVDMNLVTDAGLEFSLGEEFKDQYVVPPAALNLRYC